jgi:glycerol-3-phosphate cytidylyltransferase
MIAYCGGTFDILHPGHIKLLRWAKKEFGYLVVSLNTDEFIYRYKGWPPTMTFDERKCVLESLRYVDKVIPNIGDEDSKPSIREVRKAFPQYPIAVVNGTDWTRERLMKQMMLTDEFLKEIRAEVVIFPDSDPLHTSDIKARIPQ